MTKLIARLSDGTTVDNSQFASIDAMPLDKVEEIQVVSENPNIPLVTIIANLAAGERVWRFTRVVHVPGEEVLRIEVYEIKKDGNTLARLYWHPIKGPILTTQNIWFQS